MPPPISLANNDVLEITCVGEYQGSTILNVFHYVIQLATPPLDANAFVDTCISMFKSNVWTGIGKWQGLVTTDYTLERIRGQIVYPTRQYYQELFVGEAGTDAPPSIPSDIHMEMTLRTAAVGRGYTGNKKFTGLPLSDLAGALWGGPAQADWDTFAPQLLTTMTPDILNPFNLAVPIVWSRRRAADRRQVVHSESRPEVRVEPSRRAFRGI